MPNRNPRLRLGEFKGAPNDIGMLQLTEERNFTDSSGWDALILVLQANLFEGNKAPVDFVLGLVDDTIGTFADLLKLLISFQRRSNLCHCLKSRLV